MFVLEDRRSHFLQRRRKEKLCYYILERGRASSLFFTTDKFKVYLPNHMRSIQFYIRHISSELKKYL